MKAEETFIKEILDGRPTTGQRLNSKETTDDVIDAASLFEDSIVNSADDSRFAQLLLEELGFGSGEKVPKDGLIAGTPLTMRFLPNAATYWPESNTRPFHMVLFELEKPARELMQDRNFKLLEDAIHRMIQDVLAGFEKGGPTRETQSRQGAQHKTLCVISVPDDRGEGEPRQVVCFGTKCTSTDALEVFTLREEVRDWAKRGDRLLAEEHLSQIYKRHFVPLIEGKNWQDAFVSGEERKKASKLIELSKKASFEGPHADSLTDAACDLLNQVAKSFGIFGARGTLRYTSLPSDHSIAEDPEVSRKPGYKNPLKGIRVYDPEQRLLGFLVYLPSPEITRNELTQKLQQHNHFHNVLVIYPDLEGSHFELWQGSAPLKGRLVSGTKESQFDGEGGIVQVLSRFFVVTRTSIEKPQQLAKELAWRAKHLKAIAHVELKRETEQGAGPLKEVFDEFNQALVRLSAEEFSDAYAQTITYGMLAARWLGANKTKVLFSRDNLEALLPSTSPFLRDLFQRLVSSKFDTNLSWLLDDIASLLARTSVAEVFRDESDPAIHFYQDFLNAYDPQLRENRGVYYTPDEVVYFIVHSAHKRLQDSFGLARGLADISTWGEVCQKNAISLPKGVSTDAPFVQILDPATGTGTFLKCAIELIYETMMEEWEGPQWHDRREVAAKRQAERWSAYVRAHLLPRINGFEIMMAPYIVTHLRLGLALEQTGFKFDKDTRLHVFLTNTLEPHHSSQIQLIHEHLAEEAQAASSAKLQPGISVIVGNPPYSVASQNTGAWISELLEDFKRGLNEKKLNLDDDFVKFLRYSSYRIEQVGIGIIGLITNHIFLSAVTHRRIRQHLLERFNIIVITDLHGDSRYGEDVPTGKSNKNVFNIQQGVAAFQLVSTSRQDVETSVVHADIWGTREEKLEQLSEIETVEYSQISPSGPNFMLFPRELQHEELYKSWPDVTEWFAHHTNGVETHRDKVAIQYNSVNLDEVLSLLRSGLGVEAIRQRLSTEGDGRDWRLENAIKSVVLGEGRKGLIMYRPFDIRHTYWDGATKGFLAYPRWEITGPALDVEANLILATARLKVRGGEWDSAVVSRYPTEKKTADSTRSSAFFPLWLAHPDGVGGMEKLCNFSGKVLETLRSRCGNLNEINFFYYIVAILHSPSYRATFDQQLATSFPHVPIPSGGDLVLELSEVGERIAKAHMLEVEPPNEQFAKFIDGGDRLVKRVGEKGQSLYAMKGGVGSLRLNDCSQFEGIPLQAWELRVGGYQPCHKWMNDRKKDRYSLSDEDLGIYRRLVAGCHEIALCGPVIDGILEKHGGWIEAFETTEL